MSDNVDKNEARSCGGGKRGPNCLSILKGELTVFAGEKEGKEGEREGNIRNNSTFLVRGTRRINYHSLK